MDRVSDLSTAKCGRSIGNEFEMKTKRTSCAYWQGRDRLLHELQMMLEHHLQLMKEP